MVLDQSMGGKIESPEPRAAGRLGRVGRSLAIAVAALALAGCASTPPEPEISAAEQSDQARRASMHYDLGVQMLEADNTPGAIREFLMAVKYEPDSPTVRLALAEAYRRSGRAEEAETHLLKAVDLDPEFQRARLSLSGLYSNLGRFEEAREHAQVLADDPTFSSPWVALTNLGWAQYNLGNVKDARQNLSLALDYRNDYWPARLNLGILEAEQKHRQEALKQFRRVLAVQPGPHAEAETHYRMAEQHIALGERERAILHLTESANRRPSGPWGERSTAALRRLN